MNERVKEQLRFLGLRALPDNWDHIFREAKSRQPSYHRFLTDIVEKEYEDKKEKARLARIRKADIPEILVMETFPFSRQPRLKRKPIMEIYDSMRFITQKQELIFIGPTGCGKTGLATAFLVHAVNQGYRGRFIHFNKLMDRLRKSRGDHSETKVIRRFRSYEILLIDEMGYDCVEKEIAGLFFELLKERNRRSTTIITSQLGFEEWVNFLQDKHLTAALIDRITVNCAVFNMKECISIRPKNIIYATKD